MANGSEIADISKENRVAALRPYQFQPGQSGNPGGRPPSLAAYIRQQTDQGRELVEILLEAARDKGQTFKMADCLKAVEMLWDRGAWPKTQISLPDESALPKIQLSDLTPAELDVFERMGLVMAAIRERLASGTPQTQL